jgi:hypothetical protein
MGKRDVGQLRFLNQNRRTLLLISPVLIPLPRLQQPQPRVLRPRVQALVPPGARERSRRARVLQRARKTRRSL